MANVLSRIGIGAAEVDAVLPTTNVRLGETVDAQVEVRGGSSDQEVEGIYLKLLTMYEIEGDEITSMATGKVDQFAVTSRFTIQPGEEKTFPVSFTLPYHTPLTIGHCQTWLKTGLDIEWSLDPADKDVIVVQPDDRMQALFEGIKSLGFSLKGAKCEAGERWFGGRPFVQEFSFRPTGGNQWARRINELEIICHPGPDEVGVVVELDQRAGGFLGALGGEFESKSRFSFAEAAPGSVASQLERVLAARLG